MRTLALTVSLTLSLSMLGGCMETDEQDYHELDRLRVLAVGSQPPDLVTGETATLSALVFQPEDETVSYEWSWCPARGGAEEGFSCAITEEKLRALWSTLDATEPLPPYNLGSAQSVQLKNTFSESAMAQLCLAMLTDATVSDRAKLACVTGLSLSVRLQVNAANEEVVAIKEIVVLGDEAQERNQNPMPTANLAVIDPTDDSVLGPAEPLQAGKSYILRVDLAPELAETFLPPERPGLDAPSRRKETLVMSWFVQGGTMFLGNKEALINDGNDKQERDDKRALGTERTSFVDGYEFSELRDNAWELPLASPSEVRLFLVLRDERDGVGWAEHRFSVKGGQL